MATRGRSGGGEVGATTVARALRRAFRTARRLFDVISTDLLVRDLTTPLPRLRDAAGTVVAPLAPDDTLMTWCAAVPAERRHEMAAFHRRGDRGLVVTVDGDFAGWIWMSRVTHRDPWSGLRIRLAPDERYAYALWVEPRFRPSGVGRVLMVNMLRQLAADPSVTRVYGWVDRGNRQSQVLLRLLGFVDAQTVRRVHVARRFGRQLPGSDLPAFGPLSADGRHRAVVSVGAAEITAR